MIAEGSFLCRIKGSYGDDGKKMQTEFRLFVTPVPHECTAYFVAVKGALLADFSVKGKPPIYITDTSVISDVMLKAYVADIILSRQPVLYG